jgi:23S rRNA (uracil1939-C5)-methyltransferase
VAELLNNNHIDSTKCSVYEECGGCSYQHLPHDDYRQLKISDFYNAFEKLDLAESVFQTPIFVPPFTRRRTTLSYFFDGNVRVWGYKQHKSHKIISADDCIVVTQRIQKAIQQLPVFLEKIAKKDVQIKVSILEADNGLDISIIGIPAPSAKEIARKNLNIFGDIPEAIRFSIDRQLIGQTYKPYIKISDFNVDAPQDVFLQPTYDSQKILIDIVLENLGKTKKNTSILDIFCGIGTFSLPLTHYGKVTGFDNARPALDALMQAKQEYALGDKLNMYHRDLFRDPLSFLELNKFDIAIIDPPRAGAIAQVKQICKSTLKKVIYVFCDCITAKNDLKLLKEAGFNISKLYAIDQFVYSTHIEGVAILDRS